MRIIVDNRSRLSDADAVSRVGQHMTQPSEVVGRAYLACALYRDEILVTHDENRKSHRFVVLDANED